MADDISESSRKGAVIGETAARTALSELSQTN